MSNIAVVGSIEPGSVVVEGRTSGDLGVMQQVSRILVTHYPGWTWFVDANMRPGLIDIRCGELDGRFGVAIKVPAIYSAGSFARQVVRAGGELLERWNQRRGSIDGARLRDLNRDFRGYPIGDIG